MNRQGAARTEERLGRGWAAMRFPAVPARGTRFAAACAPASRTLPNCSYIHLVRAGYVHEFVILPGFFCRPPTFVNEVTLR